MISYTLFCYVKTVPRTKLVFSFALGDFKRFDQWTVDRFYTTENLGDLDCEVVRDYLLDELKWDSEIQMQFLNRCVQENLPLSICTIYESRVG